MNLLKLRTLIEVDALRDLRVRYDAVVGGWTMLITYKANPEDKTEVLERQRGGPRVFASLEAAVHVLARLGLHEFHVAAQDYPTEP